MTRPSILVILASPDTRQSTQQLRLMVDAMAERDDVEVHTWFLRCAWDERRWPGSTVVDELRTWWPPALLDRVGARTAAGWFRGLRLRLWLRRVDPALVMMDDGVGDRLLAHLGRHAVRLERHNREPPADAVLEAPARQDPDVVMVPVGADIAADSNARMIVEYETTDDWDSARAAGAPEVRRRQRQRLGLPLDEPLVTGWGDSGWLDGPEVFIRALWALEHRAGVLAHGAWFGCHDERHERERLLAEARRCGVEDRFHHFAYETLEARVCGDSALLPYRDTDDEQVLAGIGSGSAVVTFPVTAVADPSVRVVDHLDVDAAAGSLGVALGEDRQLRWNATLRRLDVQSLVDEMIQLAGSRPGNG